jgi:hypothetical protein
LQKLIAESEVFNKWISALSPKELQAIARVVLINWLSGVNEEK